MLKALLKGGLIINTRPEDCLLQGFHRWYQMVD